MESHTHKGNIMARHHMVNNIAVAFSAEEEKVADAEDKAWEDGKAVRDALAEIQKLESQETPRRLAEALPDDAGGSADGRAWLKANRDKIIAERAKL
jgi:hypothetical protein